MQSDVIAFAEKMTKLVETLSGDAMHKAADALMCETMRRAGYGEGVDIFERAVAGYHG